MDEPHIYLAQRKSDWSHLACSARCAQSFVKLCRAEQGISNAVTDAFRVERLLTHAWVGIDRMTLDARALEFNALETLRLVHDLASLTAAGRDSSLASRSA